MKEQNQQLSKAERRRLQGERKRERKRIEQRKEKINRLIKRVGWLVAGTAVLVGLGFMISNQKVLPSTSSQGHTEGFPESHILTTPMDASVYAHMLEHADGSGPPGVVINYNCEQFDCELDLIDKLAKIVEEYPENVYLAPYNNMSAKLTLTRQGRQDILTGFDEQRIRDFIKR